jgi:hypothetical protein
MTNGAKVEDGKGPRSEHASQDICAHVITVRKFGVVPQKLLFIFIDANSQPSAFIDERKGICFDSHCALTLVLKNFIKR